MKLIDILRQYRVTSGFGKRIDPITKKGTQFHTGIDLVGKEVNDPIEAFVEGDVIYSADTHPGTGLGGFGWVVIVKDRNGYGHMYAHLQEKSLKVKVGDHVVVGQQLGIMGSTGKSTGKHLHYEVRSRTQPLWGYGFHIDPFHYLIRICKESWEYYNRLGRKDKCNEMHETANLIRRMLGEKEE